MTAVFTVQVGVLLCQERNLTSGCVALPTEQSHKCVCCFAKRAISQSKSRKRTRPRTTGVQKHVHIWKPSDACPECCVLHANQNISLLLGNPGTFIRRRTLHVRAGHLQRRMDWLWTVSLEKGRSSRCLFKVNSSLFWRDRKSTNRLSGLHTKPNCFT
jgi:hypothetical protein